MKIALSIIIIILSIGCNILYEKGRTSFQNEHFEIEYSFRRDLTGFLDFPTDRWLKIKNKKNGISKSHNYHTDIVGDAEVHIFIDSLYESKNGEFFNVISFRDAWGVLDLNTETLENVNKEYVMNKYFGRVSKLTKITSDTFLIPPDTSAFNYFYPVIEFGGCSGGWSRKNEILRELDVIKISLLNEYKLGVVIRMKDSLKVLTLKNNFITLENIENWVSNKNLEVRVFKSNYNRVCERELDELKYFLKKKMGEKYHPNRNLLNEGNLFSEFTAEVFLRLRRNLVTDKRLLEKSIITLDEIVQNPNLKLVDLEERKKN